MVCRDGNVNYSASFLFYHWVCISARDMIRLYLKIPEKFVRLMLLDRFRVVHIPLRTLSDPTIPGQSGPGSDGNEGHFTFLKAPALLECHHQIVKIHIQNTRFGVVLPLCSGVVSVFYSPSTMGNTFVMNWRLIYWC